MHYVRGKVTRQAHVDVPEGTVEEEYGRDGFAGPVSHLYRKHPPVGWTSIEGDCRPEALDTDLLPGLGDVDFLAGRIAFLENDDVVLSFVEITCQMEYAFRNADGDEVYFVHRGEGVLETDFGPLEYRTGDYLVVPRGTAYRFYPARATSALIVQSAQRIGIPERGILGRHALFDPDVIAVPTPAPKDADGVPHVLVVQRGGRFTRVTYPFDPIDVVGWKGDLTVWRLNIADIRPVLSERYHLPPTAHVTFATDAAVICTFLPRPLETGDPKALRVPFYHANIDYDEVLFYHDGEFFSREGIGPGMVTFHPQGLHHGPHPKAIEAAATRERTDEKAVMVDTRRPLRMTEAGRAAARPEYWKSWTIGE